MKLNREHYAAATGTSVELAPERIVHLGIGAFAKAHQIWFTNRVDTNNEWGVVAFTGRTATIADQLQAQDGLYTLIERASTGDEFSVIKSIVRAVDGNNASAFTDAIANPQTALVTITITEAGYSIDNPAQVIHRLAVALDMRRRLNSEAISLVPCDNLPSNGEKLKNVLLEIFRGFEPEATEWLLSKVSFVTTSIDRITPKTTQSDIDFVAAQTNWQDENVTVTEPFKDWILSGEFPKGRPQWELAGAKFVEEIEPFENRKLWLLNGAHSILAYSGLLRGHATVAEAIADEHCRDLVEAFWAEASNHLTAAELDLPNYKNALLARFSNARIAHQLKQIAIDGATKLAVRVVPVALAELASGRSAEASAKAIGAWISCIQELGFTDSRSDDIRLALSKPDQSLALLQLLSPELANHPSFTNQLEKVVTC